MARRRKKSRRTRRRSGIRIKPSHRGRLRSKTGTKKGRKIPVSKLRKMKKSRSAATRKQATFALNARKWGRKRRRRGRRRK